MNSKENSSIFCGKYNFCVSTENNNENYYCYGSKDGCLWNSNDCTKDSDCSKYNSNSTRFTDIGNKCSMFKDKPIDGWASDTCATAKNHMKEESKEISKPLFCDSLLNYTSTEKCEDCNYPDLTPYLISNEKDELDCSNKCDNYNNVCKSYSYDQNKLCNLYDKLPDIDNINYTATGTNSGYTKEYKTDYNNLSEDEKNNIDLKCANQFLNKKVVRDKNINLKDCLKVINNNNNNSTEFHIDPECLYGEYKKKNYNPIIKKENTYLKDNIINTKDKNIEIYNYNYNMYKNTKIETENKNNMDRIRGINQSISKDHEYDTKYDNSMTYTFNPIIDSYDRIDNILGVAEKFNSNQMRNVNRSFLILVLFSIFIFFIISFYTIKKK